MKGIAHSDIRLDTFEDFEGKNYLYAASSPEKKYEVVELLNSEGETTTDVEEAAGGVVEINSQCYMVFTFPERLKV